VVACSGPPNPPSIRTTTTPEPRHHRWHVSADCTRSLRAFLASMLVVSQRRTRAQDVAGSPLEPHDGRCSDTSHQPRGFLVDAHPRLPLSDQRRSLAMVTSSPLTPTRDRRSGPNPQFSHHRSFCPLPTTPHSNPHCARLDALLRRLTAACRSASYERRRDGITTSAVGWKRGLHRTV